ncbi:MAG: DNA-directed RNA polymerase subunit M [Thermoprotei archaeon]|nr:MAG: DNA-directed RNA polymerase subunit M [Thermoprotei archaeon]HDI75282.1 DNA-directed RNA polymerase subunit M [Thermoprotei archaeon]
MEFCPKCGKVLYPVKKEGKTLLTCRACGYTVNVTQSSIESMKMVYRVSDEMHTRTSVIEKKEEDREKKEAERELVQELYKEIFSETYLESEGEGSED